MSAHYPLAWPANWPRTKERGGSGFKTALSTAVKQVEKEAAAIGGKDVVISTNVTIQDMSPRDPGVAVYFTRKGKSVCIPCDRWRKTEENLRAVASTLEALRSIDRWGASYTVDAAFTGFAALPPPPAGVFISPPTPWREVFGADGRWLTGRLDPKARDSMLSSEYRRLAKERQHDHEAMVELNDAKARALAEFEQ